jgi:hypothetical protein
MYINPYNLKKEPEKMKTNNECCPTKSGFCWKNPVHVVLFLAVLPFALNGLNTVWTAVQTAITTMTK